MGEEDDLLAEFDPVLRAYSKSLSRKFWNKVEWPDLYQYGAIALIKGFRRAGRENLRTVAYRGMLDGMRKESGSRRLDRPPILVLDPALLRTTPAKPANPHHAILLRQLLVSAGPSRHVEAAVLHYAEDEKLIDVGLRMGVTESRAHQLCKAGIARLHLASNSPLMANKGTPHFNDMMAARGGMGKAAPAPKAPPKAMPAPGKMPPPSGC